MDELTVEVSQLGEAPVVPAVFFGGCEKCTQRVQDDGGAGRPCPEAHHVGVVVLLGQRRRRHVVDHRGADAGDLVGGHGDAEAGPTDAHTEFDGTAGHRPADRLAVVGIVDRDSAVVGPEIGDIVPLCCKFTPQDLLQVEPGMVRADGDAHGYRVYRQAREVPGLTRYAPRTMALDPRTPVVVGVGQVVTPADAGLAPHERPEPVELMARALRAAAEDCDGAPAGAAAAAGRSLLARADSLRVVVPLGWHAINPALQVAARLGFAEGDEPSQLMLSAVGGNTPQALMHDACLAISKGELDVVLVTGAEAMYTRALSRREATRTRLDWAEQPVDTPAPTMFGVDKPGANDLEMNRGVVLPIHAYPLFENALRAANGWSLPDHASRIGGLWSRFSRVAAANPYAWIRQPRTAEDIVTVTPANRMISFPYPKLCTANLQVDQGAGYIVCSVEAARAAGVAEERWVFPQSGADANDHWYISERPELHRSPAIRLAGAAALELAGLGIDDIGLVDLYSCFPVVVQMAASELGLAIDDPARPLTLTGGLTFGGGPGNNYTAHGIASAVQALREAPGAHALVSGLGWFATKHSLGVYGTEPPTHGGPFAWRDAQPGVDALPRCDVDPAATGSVRIETYTVTFDREGQPERGIVACRTSGRSPGLGQRHRRRQPWPPSVLRGGRGSSCHLWPPTAS